MSFVHLITNPKMNRLFLVFFFYLLIITACDKNSSGIGKDEVDSVLRSYTKASDTESFYDEQTGFYLVPNKDVYELSNVQREYERLTGAKDRLSPTHKAIKLMPSDEATAHSLLSDTTMWVSIIPFGWRPIAQKTDPVFYHDNQKQGDYFETNASNNGCNEEGIPPVITPIYARWPIGKSIPANISYEFLYDIYTPSSNSGIDSLLNSVLSHISTRIERPDGGQQPTWHLRIRAFDSVLNSYQEVKNVHVKYKNYLNYYSGTLSTDNNGMVIVPEDVPMATTVVLLELYTEDFRVTSENSSNYVSLLLHSVFLYAQMPYEVYMGFPTTIVDLPYNFKLHVFQAARYYYKGNNDLLNNIDKLELDSPLRIAAYNDSTSLTHNGLRGIGWFFGGSNPPYIEIANYDSTPSKILGTTLHELGHASHYAEMGFSSFVNTDNLIKESFASFMGWYNVRSYYNSVLTTDSQVHNACTQGRQSWPENSNGNYTPVYIDLIDDYNQSIEENSSYVNDYISGVSVGNVLSFAIGPTTWAQSRSLMLQQVGELYTSAAFNDFIYLYPSY